MNRLRKNRPAIYIVALTLSLAGCLAATFAFADFRQGGGGIDLKSTVSSSVHTPNVIVDVFRTLVTATTNTGNVIAAAGDYADNDIISHSASNGVGLPWKFTGLGRIASGTGVITGVSLQTTVTNFAATVRVHLFSSIPTGSEFDDNSALSITTTDRGKYLGYVSVAASENMGGFSYGETEGLNKKYYSDASGDVYAIVQLTDAVTGEVAGMSVYPTLHVTQD